MLNPTTTTMQRAPRAGCGRTADKDAARQAAQLKRVIQMRSSELDALLAGVGTCSADPLRPGQFQLFDTDTLHARLEFAKRRTERLMEAELKRAMALGPTRQLATCPDGASLTRLERNFPHFGPVIALLRQRAALAAVTPGRVLTLPPILLAGPPGVGKTAFAEAVAGCLRAPTARVDMASVTASFVLAGSHSSWSGARPGLVWSLLQSPMAAGVVLVDELDKAGAGNYPPAGSLYRLLEPSTARTFTDEYMEVVVDASRLMWLATCNDPGAVEPALRSRFAVYVIPCPSRSQMAAVAGSVYRKLRGESPWGQVFPEQLPDAVAEALGPFTARELAAVIEAAVGHAASQRRLHLMPSDISAARAERQARQCAKAKLGFI